jgi:hypothetical protein
MQNSLVGKLIGTEMWNNRWYVYVGSPVFAFLGALLYWFFGIHLVSSPLGETVLMILSPGVTVIIGCAILAVIDEM